MNHIVDTEDPRAFTQANSELYCGATEHPNQLIIECVGNAVDEHVIGNGDVISTMFTNNGEWLIRDFGNGIPTNQFVRRASKEEEVKIKKGEEQLGDKFFEKDGVIFANDSRSTLERCASVMNSSGKYSKDGIYQGTSLGKFGIGLKLATWLSDSLTIVSHYNGVFEKIVFEDGFFKSREIGETEDHGVIIKFFPSKKYFKDTTLDEEPFLEYLTTLAYLCPKLTFAYKNDITGVTQMINKPRSLDQFLNETELVENEILKKRFSVDFIKRSEKREMHLSLTWSDNYNSGIIIPYVNYGLTKEGNHITAVKDLITRNFNKFAKKKGLIKEDEKSLTGDQIQEGMVCIFNLVSPNIEYTEQIKTKVSNTDLAPFITEALKEELEFWITQNEKDAIKIIEKGILARKAQEAAKKAREKARGEKNKRSDIKYINKLSDCTSTNPEECEVFIVEGDSAGGNSKTARNKSTQAVLSLRGKILNIDKSDEKKILKNNEIRTMLSAFGCGEGKNFNIEKLRYGKIIIMTDADVDGSHISTLLLTFFYRFMPELIKAEKVFRVIPPLYAVKTVKETVYLKDDAALEEFRNTHQGKKYTISRFKG